MLKKFILTAVLLNGLYMPSSFADEVLQEPIVIKNIETVSPIEFKKRNKLSINSSYFPFANSNRAMGEFMVEFSDVYGFIYSGLENILEIEKNIGVFYYDLFGIAFNAMLALQMNIPYHEFGHFSRATSLGLDPVFEGGYTNFFPYFLNRFTKVFSDSYVYSFSAKSLEYDATSMAQKFLINAGGLNNQTYLGELMSEKAYLHGTHPITFAAYMFAKIAAVNYIMYFSDGESLDVYKPGIGNDIMSMVERYRLLGKDIKTQDIGIASAISFFASGSLYSYMWSLMKMKEDRNSIMKPFEFFGVRLPETYAYYMPQGISYKISSGYRYNDELSFPISFEFIQKGDQNYEFTLGVYKGFPQFKDASVRADFIISDQWEIGGKIYGEFSFVEHLYVGAGIESYNSKTLHGLRNIPHQDEVGQTRSYEFWIQCGVKY